MSKAMKAMQLDLNVEKSATIIFGKKNQIMKIRRNIEEHRSLTLNGQQIEIKEEEKYLGDFLHSFGLSKSVEVTVKERYGKCIKSVLELNSVINDFRMLTLGGINVGLDIFQMAILPVILNNSSTWIGMDKMTLKKLEDLQHTLQRCLLGVPNSTPHVAMAWVLGMISVEHRINENKLIFLQYLIDQDDSNLSKEIYQIQKSLNFPGFVSESRRLIQRYKLPDIIDGKSMSKIKWRTSVKNAIKSCYENELQEKMTTSKLKDGPLVDEIFEKKDYITAMNISDARTNFRLRSNTTNCKMNRKSDPGYAANLWKCDACGNLDTQCHIMWCPAFTPLREGLDVDNDKDVVHYFQEVFKIRENMTI